MIHKEFRASAALVPSLATWALPAELTLRRVTDPALRRTIHLAVPAAPLPAALKLGGLLRAAALGDPLRATAG